MGFIMPVIKRIFKTLTIRKRVVRLMRLINSFKSPFPSQWMRGILLSLYCLSLE